MIFQHWQIELLQDASLKNTAFRRAAFLAKNETTYLSSYKENWPPLRPRSEHEVKEIHTQIDTKKNMIKLEFLMRRTVPSWIKTVSQESGVKS